MSRVPPGGALRVRRPLRQSQQITKTKREGIESLLHDLGSQLHRGSHPCDPGESQPARLPVGRDVIDRLLGGGFPLGALSELSGASSSGRTTLSLALLATLTARGELAGWIDSADAFDPPSAESLGVDLDRVLWVRARNAQDALLATERLIQTEGFPLVVLDWNENLAAPKTASWIRLTRLAAATRTALLLSSAERLAGPHAELALSLQPARAHFTGTPALLEQLETRMVLVRNRTAPIDPNASFEIELNASLTPPVRKTA